VVRIEATIEHHGLMGPLVKASESQKELWYPLRSTEHTANSRNIWQIKGPFQ